MKCGPGSHPYKINHVRMRLLKKQKATFAENTPSALDGSLSWKSGTRVKGCGH